MCLFLVLILSVVLLPQVAEASDNPDLGAKWTYKYQVYGTMKAGKYTTLKKAKINNSKKTTNYYCYKITLPEDGYIKVTDPDFDPEMSVYSTEDGTFLITNLSKCKGELGEWTFNPADMSFTANPWEMQLIGKETYAAVQKGTYYLCSPMENNKIKYNFYEVKNKSEDNYCMAKAKKLKEKGKLKIGFYPGREYSRWYKINLTSKKKISLQYKYINGLGIRIMVFNAKGELIKDSCSAGEAEDIEKCSTKRLSEGTYYIMLKPYDNYFIIEDYDVGILSWE